MAGLLAQAQKMQEQLLAAQNQIAETETWRQELLGRLGTVDLHREPLRLAPAVESVRVFAGYAGWTGGQLEGEIDAGGWIVAEGQPGDAVTSEPLDLWRTVLRRQPGTTS